MFSVFGEVRPDERHATLGAFLTFIGIMAGHAALETARDALFLASLPPSRLPFVYLAIAATSLLLFATQQRLTGGGGGRRGLAVWLVSAAAVNAVFWLILDRPHPWVLYAVYIWPGVFSTLVVVRFWSLLGDVFTVTQAKRLFALIGAGAMIGAIAGSALARVVTQFATARDLLLASSLLFLLTACVALWRLPQVKRGGARAASASPGPRDLGMRTLGMIWSSAYLRRVGGIIGVSTVALTLVDFLFKKAAADAYPAAELGSFFATAYLILNTASLLTQLVLVRWLVRRLGVNRVLSVLPALIGAAAVAITLGGGLIAAFLAKILDGALRHSVHRTATEVLYVPLSPDLRTRVKGYLDVVGQRGGQAVASLMILGVGSLWATESILGATLVVLCGIWIRLAISLKDFYLGLFRQTLSEASLTSSAQYLELDLESLETLIGALNSPKDGEVLATLELLAEQERTRLIPALILYHPSATIVVRALELFIKHGRDDFLPMTDRLLAREDPEVRAAVLRAMAWTAPSAGLFERFVGDVSPIVRATALVGWVSYGGSLKVIGAQASIRRMAAAGTAEERLALARAIRTMPGAAYETTLLALAGAAEPEVRLAVARAMREIRSPAFTAALIEMLPVRRLRDEARRSLFVIGTPALRELDAVLENPWGPRALRKQIPRTLTEFAPERAAEILLRHFPVEPDGSVRYRILRALGRLRRRHPELELDEAVMRRILDETLGNLFRLINWESELIVGTHRDPERATEVQGILFDLLKHREAMAMERVFRLLGLLHPGEDFLEIYRGLRSGDRQVRASSMELLENQLQPPVREAVLALVDELSDREKLSRSGVFHLPFSTDYASLMRVLLEEGSVGIRSLVAHHVGELGLTELRADLESLPSDPGGMVSRSVERALHMLGEGRDHEEALG